MVLPNVPEERYNETLESIDRNRGDESGLRSAFSPIKMYIDKRVIDEFGEFEGKFGAKRFFEIEIGQNRNLLKT